MDDYLVLAHLADHQMEVEDRGEGSGWEIDGKGVEGEGGREQAENGVRVGVVVDLVEEVGLVEAVEHVGT